MNKPGDNPTDLDKMLLFVYRENDFPYWKEEIIGGDGRIDGGAGLSVVVSLLKMVAVILAAACLGNWFLSELKKARVLQKPWYAPYLTLPGLLIIIALFIPVVVWMFQR